MKNKGRFITLEGIEGAGKSTFTPIILNMLKDAGITVVSTREPGGTEVAEAIRPIVLSKHNEAVCNETEVLLFFAARAQHITQLILPTLERGEWVLCDRFTDSSFAYQGTGRQLGEPHIRALEKLIGDVQPDLTLLLDLPAELGLERIRVRGEEDRLEAQHLDFFLQTRNAYLSRANQFPDRIKVIDASQSMEVVERDIVNVVKSFIANVGINKDE